MKLCISVGNKVLDRIEVDPEQVKNEAYLHAIRRLLYIKNELSVAALKRVPNYYIEVFSKGH